MSAPPESVDVSEFLTSNGHILHWILTAASGIALWLTRFFFNRQMEFNDRMEKRMAEMQANQAYMMGHLGIKREDER